jgi:hypothetical protein
VFFPTALFPLQEQGRCFIPRALRAGHFLSGSFSRKVCPVFSNVPTFADRSRQKVRKHWTLPSPAQIRTAERKLFFSPVTADRRLSQIACLPIQHTISDNIHIFVT